MFQRRIIRKPIVALSLLVVLTVPLTAVYAVPISKTDWKQHMLQSGGPSEQGCFNATYPSTTWNAVQCGGVPSHHFDIGAYANDNYGWKTTTNLGVVTGSVVSMTDFSSESDSGFGSNAYSIQINTALFSTYYDGSPVTAWEQFVFANEPGTGNSYVEIEIWLINMSSCPTGSAGVGLGDWIAVFVQVGRYNCTALSTVTDTYEYDASDLTDPSVQGTVSYGLYGVDTVSMCDSLGNCWSRSIGDYVLNLASNWHYVEWNVFGYCCGDQATFSGTGTYGAELNIEVYTADQSFNNITPNCSAISSLTAETNNLNLQSPDICPGGSGYYLWYEGEYY